ncbi:MAG: two-component system NarL family sensor kinase [Glaciecola sp.]
MANKELIGMVGLANRKEDYSLHMLDQLKYFISTYSVMVQALRTQEDKANTQKKLERVNKALSEEIQFRKVIQKHSLDAEERERKRVARDLHDGLGQRLTAVKLSLGAIKNGKELSGHPADILNETIKLVEGSMGEVRTISQNILPVVLSDFGLSEGLKKACEQVSESGSVLVNFKTEGESNDMEDFVKISLYRIGQECINNAIKYSKSDVIDVRVMHCSNQKYVQVRVRDYGIGFDPKKVKKGMGLNNIKERTEMIKGELLIKSKLNIGTTIQVKYLF